MKAKETRLLCPIVEDNGRVGAQAEITYDQRQFWIDLPKGAPLVLPIRVASPCFLHRGKGMWVKNDGLLVGSKSANDFWWNDRVKILQLTRLIVHRPEAVVHKPSQLGGKLERRCHCFVQRDAQRPSPTVTAAEATECKTTAARENGKRGGGSLQQKLGGFIWQSCNAPQRSRVAHGSKTR